MKKIILSVTNDLATDQRVHKVATTLYHRGNEVVLVGRLLKDSLPLQREYKTHRMKLLFTKGPLFYGEFNLRLFVFLLFQRVDIMVSNDLDTLLANYLVSEICSKPLVYDTHEYFTGVPELAARPFVQSVWESIERFIFPKLAYIYTVNNSIAKLYTDKYKKKLTVVRNIPAKITRDHWPSRAELGLPVDKKIMVMQGSGINMNRGAEEAILAMQYVEGAILLIIGGGDVLPVLKKMAIEKGLTNKLIFKPKMPYSELIGYTRLADVGLSLDKDTNINYRYSLPNKLFDYIHAGIPVLCSNIVEVAGIVNGYKIGMIVENHDPELIADKMRLMLNNQEQIKIWKENLTKATYELCWENEEKELLKVYEELLY